MFGFTIKDKEPEGIENLEVTEEPKVEYKEPKEVTDEGSMFKDVEGEGKEPLTSAGGSQKYTKNLCHKEC